MIQLLVALSAGTLLGSIPFGYLLSRMFGLGDIRAVGSGNIGATNVLRTGRRDIAALTVLLDGGKGTLAVFLASGFADARLPLVAGCAAVLGHCTSFWMGGRGGKGVATGFGVILGLAWPVFLITGAVWLIAAYASKRSSIAGLLAFTLAPAAMLALRPWPLAVATAALSAIIITRHHTNIRRLLAGTEPRIGT